MNANAAPAVVLVADDEPTMLELVARHLRSIEQPKLEVIEASDGDEAWQLARERLPDLVVLDVMMPGMSGWEVCRKIRQEAGLAHTGVLILTGLGESLNEATSPLFGADEYIDKPFDFEKLDEKIRSVLGRRAAQRDAVPRPREAKPPPSPSSNGMAASHHAPASAAAARSGAGPRANGSKKKTPSKRKATENAKSAEKGKRSMAAKKGAKKSAKKAAKKTAKKAKKAKKGRK
ncbi:MAG TPA: response regulator [Polyangiaceae bacterium]